MPDSDATSRIPDDRVLRFSTGGWVLALAGVVTLAALGWFLYPLLTEGPAPAPVSLEERGFALDPSLVPRDALVASELPRDGLRTLDLPEALTAEEADAVNAEERGKFLVSTDWVIGIRLGDVARAYPLRVLNWHEVSNDVLGGRPIAVTFSPLTHGVRVFDREIDGEVLEFGVSGVLFNSNLVMYDRGGSHGDGDAEGGESLWSQLQGRAVTGPAAARGDVLRSYPCSLTTWGAWRHHEPETTVAKPPPRLKKLYKRNPYGSYLSTRQLRFPVDPMPPEGTLEPMAPVAVLTVGDERYVLPLTTGSGESLPPFPGELAGSLDFTEAEGRYGVLLDRDDGPVRDLAYALWFGWYATHAEAPGALVSRPVSAP